MARTNSTTSIKFTDKFIAGLKPKEARYYIREARGFALRVQPSGLKTWFFIYTHKGLRKHLNLGEYPAVTLAQAREKYTSAYNIAAKGIDPNPPKEEEQKDTEESTFGYFAELYLKHSEKHHSTSWHKTLNMSMQNDVLPYWKDKEIQEIRRRDAIRLLERVASRSAGQVANVQKAASGVLDYALQRDYIEVNVMFRLTKVLPALRQVTRDRVLSDAEIKQVWCAIEAGPGDDVTKRALKLILVTAQRPGEVSGMHRREIAGNWWTIPKERAEKGKGDHLVYLTSTALSLIGDTTGYIFPSPRPDKPIHRNALAQLVSSTIKDKPAYYGLTRWTPHDLRRSARTHMARIGILDEHAEAVLAHCKQGIKKVYNLYEYQDEKKAVLLQWETELLNVLRAVPPQQAML